MSLVKGVVYRFGSSNDEPCPSSSAAVLTALLPVRWPGLMFVVLHVSVFCYHCVVGLLPFADMSPRPSSVWGA